MCRNITTLRGLEPVATPEEIEAAARQYVRKVSGVQKTSAETEEAFERAVTQVTKATTALIATLPPRKQPPPTEPPLRRIAAKKRPPPPPSRRQPAPHPDHLLTGHMPLGKYTLCDGHLRGPG